MIVEDCRFLHCMATERNGGAFNTYAFNSATPAVSTEVSLKMTGCYFEDCKLTGDNGGKGGNGGAVRSNAVTNVIADCTFVNTSTAKYGGAINLSNTNATTADIRGCSLNNCAASDTGGGIYALAKKVTVDDFISITTTEIPASEITDGEIFYSKDAENGKVTYIFETEEQAEAFRTKHSLGENIDIVHTSITNCTSKNNGGGIYHNRSTSGSSLILNNASAVSSNVSTNGAGGGIWTNAQLIDISGSTVSNNTAKTTGGGIYSNIPQNATTHLNISNSSVSNNTASGNGGGICYDSNNGDIQSKMNLSVKGCTLNENTSGGKGGGIYTPAKIVDIDSETVEGRKINTTISNCTSTGEGGGLYHDKSVSGSSLTVKDSSVSNCSTIGSSKNGGGVYTSAWTVELTDSEFNNNTSTGSGGAIFDGHSNNQMNMTLAVKGCTLNGNDSGNHGGGIYCRTKTLTVDRSSAQNDNTISNCTAAGSGGGICHDNSNDASSTIVRHLTVNNCRANGAASSDDGKGGGGIFSNAGTMSVTESVISNNEAANGNGGGIYYNYNRDAERSDAGVGALSVDQCQITGNSAGYRGGGVHTRSYLYLLNGSMITGNTITSAYTNAAGVYMPDNKTIIIGKVTSDDDYKDSSSIMNNYTASNERSNLRIWSNKSSGVNEKNAVKVLCSLNGKIFVVNANKVATQFGTTAEAGFIGFSDDDPVFKADHSTLHGIIERTDETGTHIIWAGPPICKITGKIKDEEGHNVDVLLYFKTDGNRGIDPAIFDKLDTGNRGGYTTTAAFNVFRTNSATGSDVPELYTPDGEPYEGNEFSVKMLVDEYETNADIDVTYHAGRTITFTKADKNDTDGYPYEGTRDRATITRGTGVLSNKPLITAGGNMKLENIIIDAAPNPNPTGSSRAIWLDGNDTTLTLGAGSILQNGHVNTSGNSRNGGGVYVNMGTLIIDGGTIRNCISDANGGAVATGKTAKGVEFRDGSILQCTAAQNGGGVYHEGGTFEMSGGSIDRCGAIKGGGVYVTNNNVRPFYMSGGSITRNSAETNGGGVFAEGVNSRIYLWAQPVITGNKCKKEGETDPVDCNVEMPNSELNLETDAKESVINVIKKETLDGHVIDGLSSRANIGIYVPGVMDTEHPELETKPYTTNGKEKKPFGKFIYADGCTNTKTFYCFVNDRNGLKGGLISNDNRHHCIYWIKIFSLEIEKELDTKEIVPASEEFTFYVKISGKADVPGQMDAWQIEGEYGDMTFVSYGEEAGFTAAVVTLKAGESVKAENLSHGLDYEVSEELSNEQKKKYAPLPAGYFAGKIGENNEKPDIDEKDWYVSHIKCVNMLPVCKVTDSAGNLLYRYYYDDDGNLILNKDGDPYIIPAVYTEVVGENSAFDHLKKGSTDGPLFKAKAGTEEGYDVYDPHDSVNSGTQIQMIAPSYTLIEEISVPSNLDMRISTSGRNAADFPFRGSGSAATIRRGHNEEEPFTGSMLTANGVLSLSNIILDGNRDNITAQGNGGIVNVPGGGLLKIQDGAMLQNGKASGNGGAVYIAANGIAEMSGGTVNKNTCNGDGAGIYVHPDGRLRLSGNPTFGGTGVKAGAIQSNKTPGNFNCVSSDTEGRNGGLPYKNPRQDIYLAGSGSPLKSLVITGNLRSSKGSIWVWAEDVENHGQTLKQFGIFEGSFTLNDATLKAFRNAGFDTETLNETGTYLTGDIGEVVDGIRTMVWSGLKGSCKVILRKVRKTNNIFRPIQRTFTICRGGTTVPIVVNNKELANLQSKTSGVIWIGELPYGTYSVYEGSVSSPTATFTVVVDENGVRDKLIEKN